MRSYWWRSVAVAAVVVVVSDLAEPAHARSALRGLAAAHGSEHYEGDGDDRDVASFKPQHGRKHELEGSGSGHWEWKEIGEAAHPTTRDIKKPSDHDEDDEDHYDESAEIHEEDPDYASSDIGHDADDDGDDDGSLDEDKDADNEDGSAASKSFDFEAIAGEASSDAVAGVLPADSRGVSGGYSSAAQNVATPTTSVAAVPIGESAAAAKPISEISASAIQKDPTAYGVVTPAPSVKAVPIGESAAAAKPISEISASAIQKDPEAYGVVTPTPSVAAVPIGESAAAAKPISDIDPSAIQRDPKSYGVVTAAPGATISKLADSPAAASKPSATPTPTTADKSPTQKAS